LKGGRGGQRKVPTPKNIGFGVGVLAAAREQGWGAVAPKERSQPKTSLFSGLGWVGKGQNPVVVASERLKPQK